jgi:hypothetical protein
MGIIVVTTTEWVSVVASQMETRAVACPDNFPQCSDDAKNEWSFLSTPRQPPYFDNLPQ